MLTIAVVDDRKDARDRLIKPIKRYLDSENIEWNVIGFPPLINKADYPNWLVNNKVIVLIVDEKLKEEGNNGFLVDYNGHDLVNVIRKRNKQLPIYIITSHAGDANLDQNKGEFEDIISRTNFRGENVTKYMKRFVRATQNYLDNYQQEYARLAELSEKVALSEATEEEIKELKALQSKLQLPLSSVILDNRSNWIKEIEEKTKELDALYLECKKFLE